MRVTLDKKGLTQIQKGLVQTPVRCSGLPPFNFDLSGDPLGKDGWWILSIAPPGFGGSLTDPLVIISPYNWGIVQQQVGNILSGNYRISISGARLTPLDGTTFLTFTVNGGSVVSDINFPQGAFSYSADVVINNLDPNPSYNEASITFGGYGGNPSFEHRIQLNSVSVCLI